MYQHQQQYEEEQRRLALLPTITSTVLITVFFGLFGLIPAVTNTNRARALGVQTSKYWKAFGITIAAWVLLFVLLAASSNGDSSSGAYGLGQHRGWCQPRNPHHVTCVTQLPPSTNQPPTGPWPGSAVTRF
jgi:hypothetical protein